MRVIVQIPCFNEELTLPATLAAIPRRMPGVSSVEIFVIDDGSTDGTVEVARAHGVEHILVNKANMGLGASFRRGLDVCLRLGADIIVTTDGDNQYEGADMPKLIAPIVAGEYDIVVGDRETDKIPHFSPMKRRFQRWGSVVAGRFARIEVRDAVSGYRAISRDAALRLNIMTSYSFSVDMLVQAGRKNMAVGWVPIRTNEKTRDSRLFKSMWTFIGRQGTTMMRMYAMYKPLRAFLALGLLFLAIGLVPLVRFLILFMIGQGEGKIQSVVLGGIFLVIGIVTVLMGLIADLIGKNRQLLEVTLEKMRRIELDQHGFHSMLVADRDFGRLGDALLRHEKPVTTLEERP
ncbi:glycosyltransferase family 2 protein [Sandarakinorhabdus sp. DWP1-3-1]|uniref:glycosyltransferase family 2 protein n=1 Tax=Sandarakinorhabdus sp. DWP1-3-1 TaxID=2804627 RepID=UPI003CF8904F